MTRSFDQLAVAHLGVVCGGANLPLPPGVDINPAHHTDAWNQAFQAAKSKNELQDALHCTAMNVMSLGGSDESRYRCLGDAVGRYAAAADAATAKP
jgi:hypothetical protein